MTRSLEHMLLRQVLQMLTWVPQIGVEPGRRKRGLSWGNVMLPSDGACHWAVVLLLVRVKGATSVTPR